jgi:tRNA (cytidine/uridine-2'-O-)-methyltransferase
MTSDDDFDPTNPYRFVIHSPRPEWGTDADRSLHVVLNEPEIAGNTGSIGRLCAGANIWLHLVEPMAFTLDNRYLKRAGLDYWPHVRLCLHPNFEAIEAIFPRERMYLLTKKASHVYTDVTYRRGTVIVFGSESRGLSDTLLERYADRTLRIPTTDKVRSLNLANACSIVTYEALRQLDWALLDE